jgi:hypothetical protein
MRKTNAFLLILTLVLVQMGAPISSFAVEKESGLVF